MYHPDPHPSSAHARAATVGHAAPPPPPASYHPPSASPAYSTHHPASSTSYYTSQPSPAYPPGSYAPPYAGNQAEYPSPYGGPSVGQTSQPMTGAYPHHSRYLKIHTYTPSSGYAHTSVVELEVHCTLFPQAALAKSDPSHPPAKTIRLCFGSLPIATKVGRSPGSATAAPAGQDLTLSCTVPVWDEVVQAGKVGIGGRVGIHCEILGPTLSDEEERVLERVWFGEFEYLSGAGEPEQQQPMEVGGWGRNHLRAATVQPVSHKRPGSPLAGTSPRRRGSPPHEVDHYAYGGAQDFTIVGGAGPVPYLQVDVQRNQGGSYSYDPEPSHSSHPSSGRHYASSSPLPPSASSGSSSSQAFLSPQPGRASPHFWAAPGPPSSMNRQQGPPAPIVPPSPSQPMTINPQSLSPTTPPGGSQHLRQPGSEPAPLMVRTFQLPRTPKAQRATPTSAGAKHPSPGMVTRAVDGRDTVGVQPGPGGSKSGGTTKASLLLQGDLGQMAIGWNAEEWASRRRLIQFWRRHEKGTIHAAFRPIAQADYIENSIVISCIYREDTNECYVTSVDTIYLLEALIGVRFSVEEKNRIRRNLEGLKPDTVSKNKPSTEEFFKLVMGLPKPKPRNIEKDVKVFKWNSFGDALIKIISKYSVAYEDTSRGPPSPPRVPGPLQPVPANSHPHGQPSPAYPGQPFPQQQQPHMPPPPIHAPQYQPASYPYQPQPSQADYSGSSQSMQTHYSSTGSDTSGSASLEFNPSAGSSASSMGYSAPGGGRHEGPSISPTPYGASSSSSSHHLGTSPVAYHSTLHQPQSSVPHHLQPSYHPVPSERAGSFDFTDFVVGMDAQTPPSSSTPAYPSSSAASTTIASSAVPTPSFSGDYNSSAAKSRASAPNPSTSSYPLEAFDLDPSKQAGLAGLPTTIAGLDLDGHRGVRMDEVAKASNGTPSAIEDDEGNDDDEVPSGLLDE